MFDNVYLKYQGRYGRECVELLIAAQILRTSQFEPFEIDSILSYMNIVPEGNNFPIFNPELSGSAFNFGVNSAPNISDEGALLGYRIDPTGALVNPYGKSVAFPPAESSEYRRA